MLRRCSLLRVTQSEYDRATARKRAKDTRHADGRFSLWKYAKVVAWERRNGATVFLTLVFGYLGYTQLIVYLQLRVHEQELKTERERMEWLRQTGKAKSERYIANMKRQIDDPDMMVRLPAFTGHTEKPISKLFVDDRYSTGPMHEERKTRG